MPSIHSKEEEPEPNPYALHRPTLSQIQYIYTFIPHRLRRLIVQFIIDNYEHPSKWVQAQEYFKQLWLLKTPFRKYYFRDQCKVIFACEKARLGLDDSEDNNSQEINNSSNNDNNNNNNNEEVAPLTTTKRGVRGLETYEPSSELKLNSKVVASKYIKGSHSNNTIVSTQQSMTGMEIEKQTNKQNKRKRNLEESPDCNQQNNNNKGYNGNYRPFSRPFSPDNTTQNYRNFGDISPIQTSSSDSSFNSMSERSDRLSINNNSISSNSSSSDFSMDTHYFKVQPKSTPAEMQLMKSLRSEKEHSRSHFESDDHSQTQSQSPSPRSRSNSETKLLDWKNEDSRPKSKVRGRSASTSSTDDFYSVSWAESWYENEDSWPNTRFETSRSYDSGDDSDFDTSQSSQKSQYSQSRSNGSQSGSSRSESSQSESSQSESSHSQSRSRSESSQSESSQSQSGSSQSQSGNSQSRSSQSRSESSQSDGKSEIVLQSQLNKQQKHYKARCVTGDNERVVDVTEEQFYEICYKLATKNSMETAKLEQFRESFDRDDYYNGDRDERNTYVDQKPIQKQSKRKATSSHNLAQVKDKNGKSNVISLCSDDESENVNKNEPYHKKMKREDKLTLAYEHQKNKKIKLENNKKSDSDSDSDFYSDINVSASPLSKRSNEGVEISDDQFKKDHVDAQKLNTGVYGTGQFGAFKDMCNLNPGPAKTDKDKYAIYLINNMKRLPKRMLSEYRAIDVKHHIAAKLSHIDVKKLNFIVADDIDGESVAELTSVEFWMESAKIDKEDAEAIVNMLPVLQQSDVNRNVILAAASKSSIISHFGVDGIVPSTVKDPKDRTKTHKFMIDSANRLYTDRDKDVVENEKAVEKKKLKKAKKATKLAEELSKKAAKQLEIERKQYEEKQFKVLSVHSGTTINNVKFLCNDNIIMNDEPSGDRICKYSEIPKCHQAHATTLVTAYLAEKAASEKTASEKSTKQTSKKKNTGESNTFVRELTTPQSAELISNVLTQPETSDVLTQPEISDVQFESHSQTTLPEQLPQPESAPVSQEPMSRRRGVQKKNIVVDEDEESKDIPQAPKEKEKFTVSSRGRVIKSVRFPGDIENEDEEENKKKSAKRQKK